LFFDSPARLFDSPVRFFDSPVRFDNASPLFFIPRHPTFFLPVREARGALRHRRASPSFLPHTGCALCASTKKESIDSIVHHAVDGFSFRGGA